MTESSDHQVEIPGGLVLRKHPATVAGRSAITRRSFALNNYLELTERELLVWHGHLTEVNCGCDSCDNLDLSEHDAPETAQRVLDQAASAGGFDFIQIWSPADGSSERLLIGVIADDCDSSFGDWDAYLLARWGEFLPAYEEVANEVTLAALKAYDGESTEVTRRTYTTGFVLPLWPFVVAMIILAALTW